MVGQELHSILTESQREYLRGDADLSPQDKRNRRHEIRHRLSAGIADFNLLFDNLEDGGRLRPADVFRISSLSIGDPTELDTDSHEMDITRTFDPSELEQLQQLDSGLVHMVALAFTCADNRGIPPEDLLAASYQLYIQQNPVIENADISINLDREYVGHSDELVAELSQRYPGAGAPRSVTWAVHENNTLSSDELQQILKDE